MFKIKSVMQLQEVSGTEVTRGAFTVSGEDMPMVKAELTARTNQFINRLHKSYADKLDNGVLVMTNANSWADKESVFMYRITKKADSYVLQDPERAKNGLKIKIEEEKEMREEQIEFDLTVGTDAVEVANIPQSTLKNVISRLSAAMKAKGIELSDKAAVAAYILANKEEVTAIHEEVASKVEALPELSCPIADEFMAALRELDIYTDAVIVFTLNNLYKKGEEYRAFTTTVNEKFNYQMKDIGNYFRGIMGVKQGHVGKRVAYTTGDAFRTTGNLVEAGVVKTVQALNRYVFHMAAKIVEAPVGGRPEELKDYNFVNEAAGRAWSKINPSK